MNNVCNLEEQTPMSASLIIEDAKWRTTELFIDNEISLDAYIDLMAIFERNLHA